MNDEGLRKKISSMPDASGVYLMKDSSGRVIYVGKAKSIKKRLGNYLSKGLSDKTIALISKVSDIEYRLTPNENLALLLEANLVHKYKPKYNVSLRDDKSFPLIKITNDKFPAIYITRKKENDGARYAGPYTNTKMLKNALKIIRRSFPYRSCRALPKKACIYYRLGLSPAPCIGRITKEEYAKIIKNIHLILEGKTDTLIKKLSEEMFLKSKEMKFEEASKIRDQIATLSTLAQSKENFSSRDELESLKTLLNLNLLPSRIEAFDISNISGKEACGSLVSFFNAKPDKSNYRKFRIKTVAKIDDYAMLKEVVLRRYSRLIKNGLPLPNLVLIDGGKSHLLTAKQVLKRLGIDIPLLSIAKEEENIYTTHKHKPIKLDPANPALNLIRRIRDEAHRFALAYHHVLRRKKIIGR